MKNGVWVDRQKVYDALIALRHHRKLKDNDPYEDWYCGIYAGFEMALQMLGLVENEETPPDEAGEVPENMKNRKYSH